MGSGSAPLLTASTALRLGRVSNLPTVWSNTLAGAALAGADVWQTATLVAAVALSFLYIGGMYLNDAFDREIDARERPTRPIPSGEATADTVFAAGFAMVLGGIACILPAAQLAGAGGEEAAVFSAILLSGVILAYDLHHKGNTYSPLIMGICRVLAYGTAALTLAGQADSALVAATATAFSYLIGLTYAAKHEMRASFGSLWPLACLAAPLPYGIALLAAGAGWVAAIALAGLTAWVFAALRLLQRRQSCDTPRAVTALIAGISLLDALFLVGCGELMAATAALGCFGGTLVLQRWISGT